MKRDYRKWQSPALGRDMELLVFGEAGVKPQSLTPNPKEIDVPLPPSGGAQ